MMCLVSDQQLSGFAFLAEVQGVFPFSFSGFSFILYSMGRAAFTFVVTVRKETHKLFTQHIPNTSIWALLYTETSQLT